MAVPPAAILYIMSLSPPAPLPAKPSFTAVRNRPVRRSSDKSTAHDPKNAQSFLGECMKKLCGRFRFRWQSWVVFVSTIIFLYLCSLNTFTAAELLTGPNKFGCDTCTERAHAAEKSSREENDEAGEDGKKSPPMKTVYCNASKQLLVHTPPAVLTLHLKRFQVRRWSIFYRTIEKNPPSIW